MIKTTAIILIVHEHFSMSSENMKHLVKKMKSKIYRKNFFEKAAWDNNKTICGIDEVGRGCIAGPLITASAILSPRASHPLLKDSKSLSGKELLLAYRWIIKNAKFSIGIVSNNEIDKYNIWHATLIAMRRAFLQLVTTEYIIPSAILVDAMPLNLSDTAYKKIPVHHFAKGESFSTSIAAASIVAKVTRDRIMGKLDALFPGYHLKDHKGYGTKIHKNALDTHKKTIIHRTSFLNKTFDERKNEYKEQLTLF